VHSFCFVCSLPGIGLLKPSALNAAIRFSLKVTPLTDAGIVTHIIYPHVMFGMLYHRFRQQFILHMGAEPERLQAFWTKFLATDYGKTCAITMNCLRGKTPADLDHCVPCIVHGDACPVSKKKSALFCQWGSLLGDRRVKTHRATTNNQSDVGHPMQRVQSHGLGPRNPVA
jgi:hypothetical protein